MTHQEIHKRIQEKFPNSIVKLVSDQPGDQFVVIKSQAIKEICKFLRDDQDLQFDFLDCVTGVDDRETIWCVYHIYSIKKNHNVILKADVGKESPKIDSVVSIWETANWHEREAYDMLGIHFEGHPDLRRILLPEDWEGHPLRKDYDFPEEYQGIILR